MQQGDWLMGFHLVTPTQPATHTAWMLTIASNIILQKECRREVGQKHREEERREEE